MINWSTPGSGIRILLVLELIVFGAIYCCGGRGLQSIYYMQQTNHALQQEIQQLQQAIDELQQQQAHWQTDDFYKEQVAREQLQLARPHEAVYYLVASDKS